ncbi:phosphatase PAP2 family protein [soil metagenome]
MESTRLSRLFAAAHRIRREPLILIVLLLIAGALWAFAEIADEVGEAGSFPFDEAVLLAMRTPGDPSDPLGPRWVEEIGRDLTALGGMAILSMITAAAAGYLVLQGKKRAALLVIVAAGGGMVLSTALKYGFDRPRPELVPHGSYVYTASFPSGHSMLSAVTYLTLGALLARVHPRRRMKVYFLTLAAVLAVLVGISRVYLGVHWPTDVLAGWSVGAAWALSVWLVALWLQRHHEIEGSAE